MPEQTRDPCVQPAHRLVRSWNPYRDRTYHYPDPDDPGRPLCGTALDRDGNGWEPIDLTALTDNDELCGRCERCLAAGGDVHGE